MTDDRRSLSHACLEPKVEIDQDGLHLIIPYRNKTSLGLESFNDWGGRGCHKFFPVLGGDGTKIVPHGDLFDKLRGELS